MPSRKKLKGKQKQRKTRKIKKSKKYSFDKYYGGLDKEKNAIVKYLYKLEPVSSPSEKTTCKKPNSKSGQIIEICSENDDTLTVYKSPPLTTVPIVTLRQKRPFFNFKQNGTSNVCYVDSSTMNLLIQSIICQMPEPYKSQIEHYDKLFNLENPNYYLKTLSGKGYKYIYDKTECFSVEDFIQKVINNRSQQSIDLITSWLEEVKGWIKKMIVTLNYLWYNLQFHHCDPKAAQLFISGKYPDANSQLIVGDLDKITFSLKIQNTENVVETYRVCSYGFVSTTIGSFTKSVERKLFTPSKGGGFNAMPNLSFAEKMRSNHKPNESNKYEIAAFISSILVLIDDGVRRQQLYELINDDNQIKQYIDLIKWDELQQNKDPFEKKTSHKVACKYVDVTNLRLNDVLNSKCTILSDGKLKSDFKSENIITNTVPIVQQ